MSATALTQDSFQNHIESGVSLVDFWAEWCGPCKVQLPIVEELAREMGDRALIAKVNVDEQPELAAQFGIRSIPTLLLFKDGKLIDQMVGISAKPALEGKIQAALGK